MRPCIKPTICFLIAIIMGISFLVFKTPPVRRDSAFWRSAGIELSNNGFDFDSSKLAKKYAYREAYPVFVGICFKIFGQHDNAVRIVQVMMSGFVALLVYSFARQYYGENVGFTAGLLYSFCPTFGHYPGFFLTESLLVFLFVFTCWLMMQAIDKKSLLIAACSALTLTLTLLTKSVFLFFGPFVLFMMVTFYRKQFDWNRRLVLIATMITLLPMVFFSGIGYLINKDDSIVTAGGGIGKNFLYNGAELALSEKEKAARLIGLISRNLSEKIFPDINFSTLWPYPEIVHKLIEEADSKYSHLPNRKDRFLNAALDLYKEHPFGYLINRITTLIRLNAFQYPSRLNETDRWKDFYNRSNNKSLNAIILDLVLKVLSNPFFWALGGVIVMKVKKLPTFPIIFPVLYVNLIYCFLDGIPRYGLPALPFYLIAGAVLFYDGFGVIKKRLFLRKMKAIKNIEA